MDLHFGAVSIKLNNLKKVESHIFDDLLQEHITKTAQVINIMLLVLFFVRSEGINILNMLTYMRHKNKRIYLINDEMGHTGKILITLELS